MPLNKSLLQNKAIWLSLGALVLIQGSLFLLPFMQNMIGTASLNAAQHIAVFLAATLVFILIELEKKAVKALARRTRSRTA